MELLERQVVADSSTYLALLQEVLSTTQILMRVHSKAIRHIKMLLVTLWLHDHGFNRCMTSLRTGGHLILEVAYNRSRLK